MRGLGVDPLQLFLKGSGHITHYVMIIIRYRPLRCSYKPLLLLAYIKALLWVAIVYSKSRWIDGYVHMIKEVLGRQHRKKSAARYSFAECQYSRLLKVTRLVSTSPESFSLQVKKHTLIKQMPESWCNWMSNILTLIFLTNGCAKVSPSSNNIYGRAPLR